MDATIGTSLPLIQKLLLVHVCIILKHTCIVIIFVRIAVKPIVSELCSELVKLVDWENTVIHLPAMSRAETRKVKQSEPIVDQQKQKAFDIWLKKCPEASWSHVRDALHKAGEFILEREVAEKYSLPLLAESIPMREVFSSQTNFTTDGTIGDHQLNLHPQFPGLDPLPSKIGILDFKDL